MCTCPLFLRVYVADCLLNSVLHGTVPTPTSITLREKYDVLNSNSVSGLLSTYALTNKN